MTAEQKRLPAPRRLREKALSLLTFYLITMAFLFVIAAVKGSIRGAEIDFDFAVRTAVTVTVMMAIWVLVSLIVDRRRKSDANR